MGEEGGAAAKPGGSEKMSLEVSLRAASDPIWQSKVIAPLTNAPSLRFPGCLFRRPLHSAKGAERLGHHQGKGECLKFSSRPRSRVAFCCEYSGETPSPFV